MHAGPWLGRVSCRCGNGQTGNKQEKTTQEKTTKDCSGIHGSSFQLPACGVKRPGMIHKKLI